MTTSLLSIATCLALISIPLTSTAQNAEALCSPGMKPEVAKLSLQWSSFNMFANRKETFTDSGFTQSGEGSSCKIKSTRATGQSIERPCTWNNRMSCEAQLGKDPVSISFNQGSYQRGKVQWVANEQLTIPVKRGDKTVNETRDVAVVKFVGTWAYSGNRGDSISTIYYDRAWGVMLKAEGAHDENKWGDEVTQVEFLQ